MWICETKKKLILQKKMIVNETNADNRRCIIRKIGIEKAIELLGACYRFYESPIGGKHELLQIDYDGRGKSSCYLKMKTKALMPIT